MINVGIATKGYDAPDVLIVGKLYLTTSIAKDKQVGGRGGRPLVDGGLHHIHDAESRIKAIEQSRKPYFMIIDYLSNWRLRDRGYRRYGWDNEVDWLDLFEKS